MYYWLLLSRRMYGDENNVIASNFGNWVSELFYGLSTSEPKIRFYVLVYECVSTIQKQTIGESPNIDNLNLHCKNTT